MKKILLFVLLLSFIFGCSKNVESVEEKAEIKKRDSVISEYNCFFDWGDSIIPNCGYFVVNVYVDSSFIGVWSVNWIDSVYDGMTVSTNEFHKSSFSKLYAKLSPGEHTYFEHLFCTEPISFEEGATITFNSISNHFYVGKFTIPDTGYVFVPLLAPRKNL